MKKLEFKSWLLLAIATSSGWLLAFFARIGEVNSFSPTDSSTPTAPTINQEVNPAVSPTITPPSPTKITEAEAKVRATARQIAVKIISKGETIGSGILLARKGTTYTILTNDHVLRAADPPYQIQTYDDRLYSATVKLRQEALDNNDLAILEIKNVSDDYQVARLDLDRTLQSGETVFAAGFPIDYEEIASGKTAVFTFHTGKVFLKLPKAMEGGYQIGYTNEIQKGMSGGPLLDSNGTLVAINGMHAEPLWGDPYIYKDGSQPDANLNLSKYSWGIPIRSAIDNRSVIH